jgi:hypothetical protein
MFNEQLFLLVKTRLHYTNTQVPNYIIQTCALRAATVLTSLLFVLCGPGSEQKKCVPIFAPTVIVDYIASNKSAYPSSSAPPASQAGLSERTVSGHLFVEGMTMTTLAENTRLIRAAIRAARKEGIAVVEVTCDGSTVRIPLTPATTDDEKLAETEEVVL